VRLGDRQLTGAKSKKPLMALPRMPDGWQQAVVSRARFILEGSSNDEDLTQTWFEQIQLVSKLDNGYFYTWLALTGCYPNKFQLFEFYSNIEISGLPEACRSLLSQRLSNLEHTNNLMRVRLVKPKHSKLVDVTHTYGAPYLTGIQRVVFGITNGVQNISTFVWIGDSAILQERSLSQFADKGYKQIDQSWRIRLVHRMHAQVPKLDRSKLGTKLRFFLLPLARKIKRILISREAQLQFVSSKSETWDNLLIKDCSITLPEIPSKLEHISCYEAVLENSVIPVQVVLYDFIPFFHAWTVHPGNRGHLNSYVRIVLLANRIVSISSLVQEQAKLITKAFSLERSLWENRQRSFAYLPLPSGLDQAVVGEFSKQKNLVVMAGSLEPRKNHMQFLNALEILARSGISVKARILGSAGWENERILQRIHELQAMGVDLERLGNLDDIEMRRNIAEAQVLLQISEAEGFGLPVAEALSLGTRVLVANIRPLNEWNSPFVEKVEIGNALELSKAITKILEDPQTTGVNTKSEVTWKNWQDLLFGEEATF
jgi:glycosyltransferase involved in cell wall biosynthesis